MKFLISLSSALLFAVLCGFMAQPQQTTENATDEIAIPVSIMGCDITIKAENKSLKSITILMAESDVRTKTGTWSNIYYGAKNKSRCNKKNVSVASKSSTVSNTCELDLGCNFQRRYRFKLKSVYQGKTNYHTVYYPSSTGYADKGKSVINLGNVGRHFK